MATNQPTNEPVNQFHLYDIVAKKIENTFNPLIEQLIARRDALLTKLQTMKEDFVTKETTRRAAIEELERVIRQMKEESIKVNVNLETHEKAIQVYRDQMERHQTPTKLPTPLPGTEGEGEGQLYSPKGLCTDYNGDVYVADNWNDRVSVFSKDLNFLKHLFTQQLRSPRDVKVTPNSVVVLDESPNCIHFLSRSGALLHSCVTQGEDGMVDDPSFFCLDPAGNILITDYNRHNIKILSPSGQLMHTIGKEGHGRGELYHPRGICLSQTGTIFVISDSDNFCLQSF